MARVLLEFVSIESRGSMSNRMFLLGDIMSDESSFDPRKIAAVVYDDGVAVNALLTVFVSELLDQGTRLGGVIQVPRLEPGCGPQALLELRDVATGDLIQLCQATGPNGQNCALDPSGYAEAAERIHAASVRGVDIVFFPQFSRREADGRGLSEELSFAIGCGRPVLTTIRRGLIDNWLSFSSGVGTLLDAHLWVLRNWWRELEPKSRISSTLSQTLSI